jgi:hypothetical protein
MKKRIGKSKLSKPYESRAARREREHRASMGEATSEDIDMAPPPQSSAKTIASVPLPDGIREVLLGKSALQEELRLQIKKPVMVSIDVFEGEWVYTVRGFKPSFSYWNGHKVVFYRSLDTSKKS